MYVRVQYVQVLFILKLQYYVHVILCTYEYFIENRLLVLYQNINIHTVHEANVNKYKILKGKFFVKETNINVNKLYTLIFIKFIDFMVPVRVELMTLNYNKQ